MDLIKRVTTKAILGFRSSRAPCNYHGVLIAKGDWQRIPADMKRVDGGQLRVLAGSKSRPSWVSVHLVS